MPQEHPADATNAARMGPQYRSNDNKTWVLYKNDSNPTWQVLLPSALYSWRSWSTESLVTGHTVNPGEAGIGPQAV